MPLNVGRYSSNSAMEVAEPPYWLLLPFLQVIDPRLLIKPSIRWENRRLVSPITTCCPAVGLRLPAIRLVGLIFPHRCLARFSDLWPARDWNLARARLFHRKHLKLDNFLPNPTGFKVHGQVCLNNTTWAFLFQVVETVARACASMPSLVELFFLWRRAASRSSCSAFRRT